MRQRLLLQALILWLLSKAAVVDSLGCLEFVSSQTAVECTGILNQFLTIPCGPLNESLPGNFTYQIYRPGDNQPFQVTSPTFLTWRLRLSDHRASVICLFIGIQPQAIYRLNVTYPPQTVPLLRIPRVAVGNSIHVSCPIEGNPPPFFEWRRYNDIDMRMLVPLPSMLQFDSSRKSWTVQTWTESMNGFYTCCGTNPLGTVCYEDGERFRLFARVCIINFEDSGFISTIDERHIYSIGTTVIINCVVFNALRGSQPPNWFFSQTFNGTAVRIPFEGTSSYSIQYSYDDSACSWNSSLTVSTFSLGHAGTYYCSLSNKVLEISIDLEACQKLSEQDTSLSISPRGIVVALPGAELVLSCMVNATPSDMPVWCKVTDQNDCVPVNMTATANHNCSWLNTIAITVTDDTVGQYRCSVFDKMQQVEVVLQDTVKVSATRLREIVSSLVAVIVMIVIIVTSIAILLHWYRVTRYSRTKEPPNEGFKWDAFISFHSEVEDFASVNVKDVLEARGYSVCWHHSDFVGGRTILDNISEAVDESRKVIFLFTENFRNSEYCMIELNRTLDRLQTTRTRCMIPIALDEMSVPVELKSSVTYWPIITPDDIYADKLQELLGSPIRNTIQ